MTPLNQLKARIARAKAPARGEKGAILGFILTVIILIVLVVVAFNKLSAGDSSSNGSKQQAKLDAATLINQVTEFQTNYTALLLETDSPARWTNMSMTNGLLRLANATTTDSTAAGRPLPIGPIGVDGNPITWRVSELTPDGVFAFTSANIPMPACLVISAGMEIYPVGQILDSATSVPAGSGTVYTLPDVPPLLGTPGGGRAVGHAGGFYCMPYLPDDQTRGALLARIL